jgi:uncharacterized YccA/Bax inhibitor family protein
MSTQMLNDRTFDAEQRAKLATERAGTMSYGGVIAKTLAFLVVLLIAASWGWQNADRYFSPTSGLLFFAGYIVLMALTFAAVANPRIAAGAGFFYALLMGAWMGAISSVYESFYEGIVGQAVFTSLCVFVACLFLYGFRIVKVTNKFAAMVIGATVGIGLLYFVAWIFSIFGVGFQLWNNPTPLGIGLSIAIALAAALNLFLDFAVIERGVSSGASKDYEWYCAYGLLSTLVWLYVEILRVLALLRRASS